MAWHSAMDRTNAKQQHVRPRLELEDPDDAALVPQRLTGRGKVEEGRHGELLDPRLER